MWLISHWSCCKWLLKTSHSSAARHHLARKHAAGDRYQRCHSNHTLTSALWRVLIYLPLLRGSAASQSEWIIPCGPTTTVHRARGALWEDSQASFSIGVLTLMDTQNTPSCLRTRILCRRPAILPLSSSKVLGNNWLHGCCGGVICSGLPVSAAASFCERGAGGL